MNARTQISLDPDTQRRARVRAEELGISFGDYVRRAIVRDLAVEPAASSGVGQLFDMIDEGEPTEIAKDKDLLVVQAVAMVHARTTGQASEVIVTPKRRRT